MREDSIQQSALRQCKRICGLLVLTMVAQAHAGQPGQSATQSPTAYAQADRSGFLQITVINMSGKHREAVVRKTVIDLPVAERVVLLLREGEAFQVRSDADARIKATVVVTKSDVGRIIPVS
jgi:hypothetical protein